MKRRAPYRSIHTMVLAVLAVAVLMTACERKRTVDDAFPRAVNAQDTCAVDGMMLLNHPGPKGQIIFTDGSRAFYCDVREAMEARYDPEQSHRIAKLYVQSFDGRDWGSHPDGWVEAGGLSFVLGSERMGHMGPAMVPFEDSALAEAFVREHGGRIVAEASLDAAALADYAREVHEFLRSAVMRETQTDSHGAPGHPHRVDGAVTTDAHITNHTAQEDEDHATRH